VKGKKVRNIRGKIKNVGAPTFLSEQPKQARRQERVLGRDTSSPCFCVSRGSKRLTRGSFVCWGKKEVRGRKLTANSPQQIKHGGDFTTVRLRSEQAEGAESIKREEGKKARRWSAKIGMTSTPLPRGIAYVRE
jgi:hypothetical protein